MADSVSALALTRDSLRNGLLSDNGEVATAMSDDDVHVPSKVDSPYLLHNLLDKLMERGRDEGREGGKR